MDKRPMPEPGVQESGKYQAPVAKPRIYRQTKTMRRAIAFIGFMGSWVANALTWFGVPGAVAVSAALASLTFWYGKFASFVASPTVHLSAEVFLFSLWTIIGVMAISQRNKPLLTKRTAQLEYGICIESVLPIFNPNTDHALQLQIIIRNLSGEPLKYKVESISIDIETRHVILDDDTSIEGIIGFGAGVNISSNSFPKSDIEYFSGKRFDAKCRFKLKYGPVSGQFRRMMDVRLLPVFDFTQMPMLGFSAPIKSYIEEDI